MAWEHAFNIIISLMIGIIAFYMKAERSRTNEEINRNAEHVTKLDDRIDELERSLPFTYVTREDYIRQLAQIDNKLDKIYSSLERGRKD
ncbi:hypothetical protein [Bacillus sp. CGMCC 1.16541]|uniref:hypothetical protein n=1 Tax=Bacillus sp. CGMCC 1.16541 TaxID=2185143 RepID=UPI000D728920|nr:hypothetical protein [Bacillus sp. CGMCC 1.16541]